MNLRTRAISTVRSKYNRLQVLRRGDETVLESSQGSFSYYHPKKLFTGYAWDCLSVSPMFSQRRKRRILLLGLGGGTVARQCRCLYPDATLDAVEVDLAVIRVARDYFHLPHNNVRIIHADAVRYLTLARQTFDAILDDTWLSNGNRRKPLLRDRHFVRKLLDRLSPRGILAVTLLDRADKPETRHVFEVLTPGLAHVALLRPPYGSVSVLVAGHQLRNWETIRKRLVSSRERSRVELGRITCQRLA